MTLHGPAATAPGGTQSGWASPIVVMPILALIVNVAVQLLAARGLNPVYPIEVIAGFRYPLAPLITILEALVLGFGLWHYAETGAGRATLAAICVFVFRIVTAIAVLYGLRIMTAHLSDEMLTSPISAYSPLFLQVAFSGAAILLALAIFAPSFRSWGAWIWTLLIWAGGAVLLFWLYRNSLILTSRDRYLWLAQIVRALGFLAIGCYLRPARR